MGGGTHLPQHYSAARIPWTTPRSKFPLRKPCNLLPNTQRVALSLCPSFNRRCEGLSRFHVMEEQTFALKLTLYNRILAFCYMYWPTKSYSCGSVTFWVTKYHSPSCAFTDKLLTPLQKLLCLPDILHLQLTSAFGGHSSDFVTGSPELKLVSRFSLAS